MLTSIIIPSRCDEYLQRTIDELLEKAGGDIEIIVVLDGYWPNPMIKDHPKVRIIHHGMLHDSFGMRDSINKGMALAKGDYVMKIDEHCMVDKDFDLKLAADCEENWMIIPRRYRLDAPNWKLVEDGRPPIDYNYITYPFLRPNDVACGLHGAEWKRPERADILIDDTVTCQGSCYYTTKKWWDKMIAPMDASLYGQFINEAQEVNFKTWFGGGRVMVNKKTWYAHYHKGKDGKNYGFSNAQYRMHQEGRNKGRKACIDFWINNKWDKRVRDWEWLIDYFKPMPSWGENWREDLKRDAALERPIA
jgi:glycosyltransferase involved in cell wall biosynthesis